MSNGNLSMSAKGRYGLSILDKNGKIKKEKSIDNNTNVVTYEGAYTALIKEGIFDSYYAAIGTGTTEIIRSVSSLGAEDSGRSPSASASRSGNEVDNGDGTSTVTLSRSFTFSIGAKVGTFSEVGVYDSSTGGTFIAGQLIKDEFGSPTTVTILADEQLVVTYILEWTVPTVSQLIGSGTLTDNASNTYDYEVYAQPYFAEYSVGSTNSLDRYTNDFSGNEIGFYAADGTTSLYDSRGIQSFASTETHNGSGTVTFLTGVQAFSPSQGSYTGLTYLSFYGRNSPVAVQNGVFNTTTNIAYDSQYSRYPLLIKFLNPITKTSSQSFEIAASFTITL